MIHFTKVLAIWAVLLSQVIGKERPNIVFIMADDLGIGDLSSHGAKDMMTPNIDELMKSESKFKQVASIDFFNQMYQQNVSDNLFK